MSGVLNLMIPQRRLAALGNRLAEELGRRIQDRILERDYCIAWFLVGVSRTPLQDLLAFKGGTALKRCYFLDYRFSEDLDFSLLEPTLPLKDILDELTKGFAGIARQSGIVFNFSREDQDTHRNSYTFYITYSGPIPRTTGPGEIKIDITIRELVVFPLLTQLVLPYEEYDDLPEAGVRVYSLEEIATEKIMALTDPARTEPRDLYDLWFLIDGGHVALRDLADALTRKLGFKDRPAIDGGELDTKEDRLKTAWERRLAHQVVNLPEFATVLRLVQRELRRSALCARMSETVPTLGITVEGETG